MKTLIIERAYTDEPHNIVIGAVKTNLTAKNISHLWDIWREEVPEPDSDSQFIDWLIENHGCKKADYEILTIED